MPLTDTVRAILIAAAERPDHIAQLPERLPTAARQAVARSMLRAKLLEEKAAGIDGPVWRIAEDGQRFSLRATFTGLEAIGYSDTSTPAGYDRPLQVARSAAPGLSIRATAQALLAAWDGPQVDRPTLTAAVDALRAALAKQGALLAHPRQLRTDTKRAAVIALLRRPEGATVAQVVDATGWARHTVHGFFASLRKAGMSVEVLERVRQVGPGKQGAAGSYTVYRVMEAG